MQAKNGSVILTVIICAVLLGGLVYLVQPDEVTIPEVPTAAEIAALISIPNIDIPESISLDEIVVGIYEGDVKKLEEDVQSALWDEFDDEYMDEITDLIEDAEDDDIENLNIIDWNYRNDYKFTILNLGLDDEEDRAGQVDNTFKVQYNIVGEDDLLTDKVYITGTASNWDDRDNEFDTVDAIFTL